MEINPLDDNYFMKEAFKEAQKAFVDDEVPVGCVVVCNKKIIARARIIRGEFNAAGEGFSSSLEGAVGAAEGEGRVTERARAGEAKVSTRKRATVEGKRGIGAKVEGRRSF